MLSKLSEKTFDTVGGTKMGNIYIGHLSIPDTVR